MTRAEAIRQELEQRQLNAFRALMDTPNGRDAMSYLLDMLGWQKGSVGPLATEHGFLFDAGYRHAGERLFNHLRDVVGDAPVFTMLREQTEATVRLREAAAEDEADRARSQELEGLDTEEYDT